jgi:hypothetical protein
VAYASIYHIVAHHPARPTYTATSVPNASYVAMLIDEAAAELDFSLTKGGYDAPLLSSAPSSVKAFMQKANSYGAIAMIEPGAQASHNQTSFMAMWNAAKQMIENGELPNMDRNDAQSMPRMGTSSASGPIFSIDMCL